VLCRRADIQENIKRINLERELREKSSSLTQVEQKFANLQEVCVAVCNAIYFLELQLSLLGDYAYLHRHLFFF